MTGSRGCAALSLETPETIEAVLSEGRWQCHNDRFKGQKPHSPGIYTSQRFIARVAALAFRLYVQAKKELCGRMQCCSWSGVMERKACDCTTGRESLPETLYQTCHLRLKQLWGGSFVSLAWPTRISDLVCMETNIWIFAPMFFWMKPFPSIITLKLPPLFALGSGRVQVSSGR